MPDEGPRERKLPWILTLTLLALIYDQIPAPVGAVEVKAWLDYVLPLLGTLLLGQFLRQTYKTSAAQLRHWWKRIRHGFTVRFEPRRTGGTGGDDSS